MKQISIILQDCFNLPICGMLRWVKYLAGGTYISVNVVVAVGQKVYSFGWHNSWDQTIEVRIFNTVSLCWMTLSTVTVGRELNPEVPSNRLGHTVVLIDNITYLWGGRSDVDDTKQN